MKNLFIILGLILLNINLYGRTTKRSTLSRLGLDAGLSQNMTMSADVYGGGYLLLGTHDIETNIGYMYFDNKTEFDNVKDLLYKSHGAYIECSYYMLPKIYIGARFALNMNFVSNDSQNKYDLVSNLNPPTYFTGTLGLIQIGFKQVISDNICLKLQGQIGLHNYYIGSGALYFTNSDNYLPTNNYIQEKQANFICNISLGLSVNISSAHRR